MKTAVQNVGLHCCGYKTYNNHSNTS